MYKSDKKNNYKTLFVVVLIIVVLSSCLLVGTVSAWLVRQYTYDEDRNQIGSVHMEIYHNGTKMTGRYETINGKKTWICNTPYQIAGGSTLRTLDLTIRNAGTIDALVRATINIYYIDDFDNQATDTDKRPLLIVNNTPTVKGTSQISTTNWVYDFPSATVACGYMFYNSRLSPYVLREPASDGDNINTSYQTTNEIDVIQSIRLSEAQKDTTIYIDLTIEAVAADGNIYKKMEEGATAGTPQIPVNALPFGLKEQLPASWTAWRETGRDT